MITKLTVQLTPEASQCVGIAEFYKNVAAAMGISTARVKYDCTKITVARNIQSNIFETLDAQSTDPCHTGMSWCVSGPKTDDALPDDTVEVFDGFFLRGETPLTLTAKTNWSEVLLPSIEQLYDKLTAEYEALIEELKNANRDTIIERAYEKVFKLELLMCFDFECTFDENEIAVLMSLDTPLDDMYRHWLDSDANIADMLRENISDFAQREITRRNNKESERNNDFR